MSSMAPFSEVLLQEMHHLGHTAEDISQVMHMLIHQRLLNFDQDIMCCVTCFPISSSITTQSMHIVRISVFCW